MIDALDRICQQAEQAIDDGFSLVVLSDRQMGADRIAISTLLACGAVHHHLVRKTKRTQIGLIVESGEAREVHHHCLLIGYGADAINPYLAFEAIWAARADGRIEGEMTDEKITEAYRLGVKNGMLKVMAKMGISTLQSYKGAQIFEAIGLRDEVIQRCFAGTASRIQGVDFKVLAEELLRRHKIAYPDREEDRTAALPNPGEFHWRSTGERHMWDPQSIADLQMASRANSRDAYQRFSDHCNHDAKTRCALRGLLKVKPNSLGGPIPLEEVESAQEIVKRFCTGAMSFGSISAESHETLAIAMNRLGGKSNTGEGRRGTSPLGARSERRFTAQRYQTGSFRSFRRHH